MTDTHCEVCSSPTEKGRPCDTCGSSVGEDFLPQTAPRSSSWGLHTTTGTVTTPAQCELRRPYLAAATSITSGVVLIATSLRAPSHPLTHQLTDELAGWLSAAGQAVVAAALLALQPLLPYVVIIAVIAVGLRLVLVPILGPPGTRPGGRLGRLLTGLLAAGAELALRALVAAFHLAGRAVHLALGHLLRPEPRFSFALTAADHQQYRVRISRHDLALRPGDQVSVTGLTLARTTHAYRLHSPGTPARYPRPTLAGITALVLGAAALTALTATL